MRVLAVDLGASSARVASVDLDRRPPVMKILRRYRHGPVRHHDGTLRWDWERLNQEVLAGLQLGLRGGRVASIGVDTWGVDYGLLDSHGDLLSPPFSYRDDRTAGWGQVADRLGRQHLYCTTGTQLMGMNTIFQLAAHDPAELAGAAKLLMLPELVVYRLTGEMVGERTSAGTTGLVSLETGAWSEQLLDEIGLDGRVFPPLRSAPEQVGAWQGVPVHLVGGHDTSSAVVAMSGAPQEGAAFASIGTWVLVGMERRTPLTSYGAFAANFSNEAGAVGGVRFLKNLAGLWLLEESWREWGRSHLGDLIDLAGAIQAHGPTIEVNDPRFIAPPSMVQEIIDASGLGQAAHPAVIVRCILDSIAGAVGRAIDELEEVTGVHVTEIHVLGGGTRNRLLLKLIEAATGRPLREGPAEATVMGNALVQGMALGRYANLDEARCALSPVD